MISKLQKTIAGNKKTVADITEMAIQAFDQVSFFLRKTNKNG